jgi:hypothetical protein
MAAGEGHDIDGFAAQLVGKLMQRLTGQRAQIGRIMHLVQQGGLRGSGHEIPQQILEFADEDEIGDRPQKIGFLVEQIKVMYRLSHKRLRVRAGPLRP